VLGRNRNKKAKTKHAERPVDLMNSSLCEIFPDIYKEQKQALHKWGNSTHPRFIQLLSFSTFLQAYLNYYRKDHGCSELAI
jgi:hypothetical protein